MKIKILLIILILKTKDSNKINTFITYFYWLLLYFLLFIFNHFISYYFFFNPYYTVNLLLFQISSFSLSQFQNKMIILDKHCTDARIGYMHHRFFWSSSLQLWQIGISWDWVCLKEIVFLNDNTRYMNDV